MPRARSTSAAPALDLPRTLSYRMHLLHKLTDLDSQRQYPQVLGLSLSDGRCLAAVGAFEPISVNQLAQLANLNKAQASRAAQYLVDQGLLARRESQDDKRSVELRLTPRGRTLWRKAMALIERRNQEIFGSLSAGEQALLGQLFDRLIAANGGPAA